MLTSTANAPELSRTAALGARSSVRAFTAADARAVADLLVRAFQHSNEPAPEGMATYLREVYLDAPWFDADVASRVLVGPRDDVVGFVGVCALPMSVQGRKIRAATISSLAVDPRRDDPLAGARLLRAVCSGPQDVVLSDRSNAASVSMLRGLKGEVFVNYSFDWRRTLRPLGVAVDALASRVRAVRLLAPLAVPFDGVVGHRLRFSPTWSAPQRASGVHAVCDRAADLSELLDLLPRLVAEVPLRPEWTRADLTRVLGDGAHKAELGRFCCRVVETPKGQSLGFFAYHLCTGRIAHVLQIMAFKGRESAVVDSAIAHAAGAGAIAIGGRAQPPLLDALAAQGASFRPELATVVCTRDLEILQHFRDGTAFFTGLAGENWMRLNGDRF